LIRDVQAKSKGYKRKKYVYLYAHLIEHNEFHGSIRARVEVNGASIREHRGSGWGMEAAKSVAIGFRDVVVPFHVGACLLASSLAAACEHIGWDSSSFPPMPSCPSSPVPPASTRTVNEREISDGRITRREIRFLGGEKERTREMVVRRAGAPREDRRGAASPVRP
jgi:hypothetical protein